LQGNELLNVMDFMTRIKWITWGKQMSKECARERRHWIETAKRFTCIMQARNLKDRLLK